MWEGGREREREIIDINEGLSSKERETAQEFNEG
jgi:hypothetical protein